jgi:two-component system, OmpR family, alkaline phosphatase synthesis response regulator PhoP
VDDKIKILVVDDEILILNTLVTCLESLNYKVITATNGLEAYEIAKKEIPTVIVSDIGMPLMDGFELCAKVRKDSILKDVPFIVLTGSDSKVALLKGFENGVNDYVTKPIYATEIICRVKSFVNLRLKQFELLKKIEKLTKELNKSKKKIKKKKI